MKRKLCSCDWDGRMVRAMVEDHGPRRGPDTGGMFIEDWEIETAPGVWEPWDRDELSEHEQDRLDQAILEDYRS